MLSELYQCLQQCMLASSEYINHAPHGVKAGYAPAGLWI